MVLKGLCELKGMVGGVFFIWIVFGLKGIYVFGCGW